MKKQVPDNQPNSLEKSLTEVERGLEEAQKLLTNAMRTSAGIEKRDLEKALNALNPVIESFKENKDSITKPGYMEKLRDAAKSGMAKLDNMLGFSKAVEKSPVLMAVKDVLNCTYTFATATIANTLNSLVKTGLLAESVITLGEVVTGYGPQNNPNIEPDKHLQAAVPPHNKQEPIDLTQVLEQVEKSLVASQECLTKEMNKANGPQKAKLQTALDDLKPVMDSFKEIKEHNSEAGKRAAADHAKTVLGKLQNWKERGLDTLSNKFEETLKDSPHFKKSILDVLSKTKDLVVTTITNMLENAKNAGKVAGSVAKLCVALGLGVGKKAVGHAI